MFHAQFSNLFLRGALQPDLGQRLALATAYKALEMSEYVPNCTSSTQLDRISKFHSRTADEYQEQSMSQDIVTYVMPGSIRACSPVSILS